MIKYISSYYIIFYIILCLFVYTFTKGNLKRNILITIILLQYIFTNILLGFIIYKKNDFF